MKFAVKAAKMMTAAVMPTALFSPFTVNRKFFCVLPAIRFERLSCTESTFDNADERYISRKSIKCWDKFYKNHRNKFFKDRHYLEKDWGAYFSDSDERTSRANSKVLLEIGCGAGNTIFPLIAAYPKLFIHACDFSAEALSLVKVFMLSAVCPNKMAFVLQNLKKVLKPNGHVLVRDYAFGDSAQVKLEKRNQMISDNFYYRGDGTFSFYFSEDFLSALFAEAGFATVDINTYCRQVENRLRNMTFQRRWIRAIFRNTLS